MLLNSRTFGADYMGVVGFFLLVLEVDLGCGLYAGRGLYCGELRYAYPQIMSVLGFWSLVRTHSGASFVINFASLSPASAWPSLA